MMSKKFFSYTALSLIIICCVAQVPNRYPAGEIYNMLQKLNTVGSVLYVAAHPDDENTQLITYFAKDLHLETAYLSATRGDGGQNLIGTEIKEQLGIIRTQELLRARSIDGGQQFFSRAIDFGYSKHPDETFTVWDKDQVLEDFVWVYRNFRPDIIVTRFSQEPGVTHGHHTASAILAMEAYEKAGNPDVFPDQLAFVKPWQPKKIFWNVGTWSYRRSGKTFDPTGHVTIDVGGYDPLIGFSFPEIAALSRSSHKSQGFGQSGSRGQEHEYLKQWSGEDSADLFDGIDLSWNRVDGSEKVQQAIDRAINNFDLAYPSSILPQLLEVRNELLRLPDQYWKEVKLAEANELILTVTGSFLEARTNQPTYTMGDSINIEIEATNRSEISVELVSLDFNILDKSIDTRMKLNNNQPFIQQFHLPVPEVTHISQPYWLAQEGSFGMYTVRDPLLRGKPENEPVFSVRATLKIGDQYIDKQLPVVFKTTDRVKGEVYQPIIYTPKVMINVESGSLIFGDDQPKEFTVRVISAKKNMSGKVVPKLPKGWSVEPVFQDFSTQVKGEEKVLSFILMPPKKSASGQVSVVVESGQKQYNRGFKKISYNHIPDQAIFPKASFDVTKIALKIQGTKLGYIMGAGDEVPAALGQIGYDVHWLDKDDITEENMAQFDAVMLGVRAFNVHPWLTFKNQELFKYAESGGTVVVQYNTMGVVTKDLAPYALQLSRDRVSVEGAPVEMINTTHPVLNRPNKILKQDFENWVQERGLYFPNEWSPEFEPILSMHDPGEDSKLGSLLVAKHGKGYYVYTGLSFFRELPAGVPGAYRLLANILSLKQNDD